MIILPAIDLYAGKAVRLLGGDYSKMTVYSDDPLSVARDFERLGASHIHIVDLEGAKNGNTPNLGIIKKIAEETSLEAEVGGGIRSMETIEKYLGSGISRVILGTAAVSDRELLRAAVSRYGDKIAIGADVKDGFIAVRGWTEKSEFTLETFLREMQIAGIKTVICTDISRDGAMKGTNLELYKMLSEKIKIKIIASGGVSSIDDITELRRMELFGAIIGKAYYTGAIDLRRAIEVAR